MILDNNGAQDIDKDDSRGNDELKGLLIERDILTESNIFIKNKIGIRISQLNSKNYLNMLNLRNQKPVSY